MIRGEMAMSNGTVKVSSFIGKAVLHGFFMAFAVLASTSLYAGSWQEDEEIDRQLGLFEHTARVNLISVRTRDYLRLKARVMTGMPAYDQQVERASEPPAFIPPPFILPVL